MDMWRVLRVSMIVRYYLQSNHLCRELAGPQGLISYLLRSEIANLRPDIIAVYIQAALKIFGFWAAELAQRWQDDRLPEVKSIVEHVMFQIQEFTSSFHIEVQERVGGPLSRFQYGRLNFDVGGQCASVIPVHRCRSQLLPPKTLVARSPGRRFCPGK